jgi:PKD domain
MPSGRSARGPRDVARLAGLVVALLAGIAWISTSAATGPAQPPNLLTITATAAPLSGPVPLTVAFAVHGSGGFPPYFYNWTFGDGSPNATTQFVNHTYRAYALYTVDVTVVDDEGEIASTTVTVDAGPDPLTVSLSAVPSALAAGGTTYLETSVQGGVPPFRYAWSGLPDGCPAQSVENLSCTPRYGGSYVVNVTVVDARNSSSTATIGLVVTGPGLPPPSKSASPPPDYTYDILAVVGVGALAVVIAAVIGRRARRSRAGPGG